MQESLFANHRKTKSAERARWFVPQTVFVNLVANFVAILFNIRLR